MIIIISGRVVYSLSFLNKTRLINKHSIFTVTVHFSQSFPHKYSDQLISLQL